MSGGHTLKRTKDKRRGRAPEGKAALSSKQLFDAQLAGSGLDAKDARRLQLTLVANATSLDATLLAVPAMKLPYFDLDGKPTRFFRARYLGETKNGFDRLTEKDAPRYGQPTDSVSEVYLPPLVDWRKLAADPKQVLVVTEGEKKAAATTKAGAPCLGLGGVWMFKSSRHGLPFLPSLQQFQWQGREVRVAFDSDALTNPDVLKALHALCNELAGRGALPKVVRVPPLGAGKTGLDDYYVARGGKALLALLEQAEPFGPVAELMALNTEVAYVKDPGIVVVLADGRKLTPGGFREHAYANRFYYEEVVGKYGTGLKKLPAAPAWLSWEQRNDLTRLTFKPGGPRITPEREYNYWPGWAVEPKRGSVKPWSDLLDFIFEGNEASRTWFEQWCAYPLQHPGVKLYTAAVVWGRAHGTGKSLLGYSLMQLYGKCSTEIDDEQLNSAYNEWAEAKQFVMGDDVTSGENKRWVADRLKFMITRLRLRLNPKYVPSYEVPDCINYYFTSQHPDAFFIEDTDRRYFVHEVQAQAPLERSFYTGYLEWLKGEGAAALFHHLLHVSTSKFDPNGPALETAAKLHMQEDSLSELGTWVRQVKSDPEVMLRFGQVKVAGDLFTSQDLHRLFDPDGKGKWTVNQLGRELKRAGFRYACRGTTIRTDIGQVRLFAVRQPIVWGRASSRAAAAHYWQSRGAGKTKKFAG